jgi:chemotaxis protein methyltransferase CheR
VSPNRPVPVSEAVVPRIAPLREFEYSQADFERVRRLIHSCAGISLSSAKQDMVYSRLTRRLRALKLSSFTEYLDRLEGNGGAEWERFVNALTTNLTAFFREAHHFDALKQHVKAQQSRSAHPVRLWCSAASTGEEAYSMAIAMCELFDSLAPPVQILASDLDTEVLAVAAAGAYGAERVERMDSSRLHRYFVADESAPPGAVRVRPELQKLLRFKPINLLRNNWQVSGPLDAIFCRNVMIYFDRSTQYGILKRFVPLLRPNGLLFAGHSESFMHAADLFRPLGRTVYEPARA